MARKKETDAAEDRQEERLEAVEANREEGLENPEIQVDREVTGSSQGTADIGSVAAKSGPEDVNEEGVNNTVADAIEEAADAGEFAESEPLSPLSVQEAEVQHADEAYNLDVPGFGVADTTTVADLEARQSLAADSHREVENDDLGKLAIDFDELNSIRPDEKVQVVVRERTEDDASDFGVESLEQERIVKELAESGQLFDKGGPLVNWTGDKDDLSDGVDGLFLAERSKQTGTKLF